MDTYWYYMSYYFTPIKKIFKSDWKNTTSDSEIMYLYIFASSATSNINDWINTVVTSLYIKNKRGEIWSSWGTPEETGMEPDKKLPHLVNWNLFRKNENNQERRGSWISYLRSFKINKLWLISSIYGISNILAIFRQRL